jgi:hypothetical protein
MKMTLVGIGILMMTALITTPPVSKMAHTESTTLAATPPQSKALPSADLSPGVADTAITLWAQGRKAEALSLLLEGERSGQRPISPPKCLSLSEAALAHLPQAEHSTRATELEKAGEAAKEIAKIATARIVTNFAQGERTRSMQWAARVDSFGGHLAGPDYAGTLQKFGHETQNSVARFLNRHRAEAKEVFAY